MNDDFLMPFGKHKGRPIGEIPRKYLRWLDKNADLYGDLEIAVKKRLGLPLPEQPDLYARLDEVVNSTPAQILQMETNDDR